MDRAAEVGRATFVDPEALLLFLDALRRAGYRIGTTQYIAAQDLVLALAAQGRGAVDAERFARMLGPLVCATAKEQAEFGAHFGRWVDRLFPARQQPNVGAPADAATGPAANTPRGLAEELDAIQRSSRLLRWVIRPVSIALAVVLVVLYVAFRGRDGTLLVHSTPDRAVVNIVLDSTRATTDSAGGQAIDSLGVTPLRLTRKAGRYRLQLTLPEHRDTIVTVDVSRRETRDVDVGLRKLGTGALWVRTRPGGARVVLDTSHVGTTPVRADSGLRYAAVPEGAHRVRLLLPGHRQVERNIEVGLGRVDSIDVALEPVSMARVAVTSTPPGATVTLDGREVGRTPLLPTELERGQHDLRLSLDGYGESITALAVARDTALSVVLAPLLPLRITSRPSGGRVTVDGVAVGVTPVRMTVTAGTHDVVVGGDAYEEFHRTVQITVADSLHADLVSIRRHRQRLAINDRSDTIVVGDSVSGVRTWHLATRSLIEGSTPQPLLTRLLGGDIAYDADSTRTAVPNGASVLIRSPRDTTLADTLEEQGEHVSSVAFSADGRFLASGDASGGIRIWAAKPQPAHTLDLPSPRWTYRLSKLLGRRPKTEQVRVSTGGELVVTTSAATGVLLWNVKSGALLETLISPDLEVAPVPVIISTDGRRIMRLPDSSEARFGVDVWDVDSVRSSHREVANDRPIHRATMRSDGRQVATVDQDGVVQLWDIVGTRGRIMSRTLPLGSLSELDSSGTTILRFSPDGRRLLAVHEAGTVYIWSTTVEDSSRPPAILATKDGTITTAYFTGDGRRLVTTDTLNAPRVWDLDRPGEFRLFTTRTDSGSTAASEAGPFQRVAVSPVGSRAVTVSRRGAIQLWNLDSLDRTPRLLVPNDTASARRPEDEPDVVNFSADGRWLLLTFIYKDAFQILSVDGSKAALHLPRNMAVTQAMMTDDGAHVVVSSRDAVSLWNTNGITELADLEGHKGEVHGLSFSHDGRRLASAGADGKIKLWDTRTFAPIDSVAPVDSAGRPEEMHDVLFSPDGRSLAAVSPTATVRVYDTPGSRWRTVRNAIVNAWPIALALVLLPLPWLLYRWFLRRRATAFVRRQSDEQPDIEHIALRAIGDDVFSELSIRRIASRLRRRVEVPSEELDVVASVAGTLRRGGVFTPSFRHLKVTPEYLALIDRATLGDQQAAFIDDLLGRLRADDVVIARYYFDEDPRVCFPVDPHGLPVTLSVLTQKYDSHRVLLFADARRCFNPVTGEMAAWTELMGRWASRTLLTPEIPERWGDTEATVAREFAVHHASITGLAELADGSRPARSATTVAVDARARFPSMLQHRPGRWIERDAPPNDEVEAMLAQVSAYLDDAGMTWFAACAVYPAMSWKLTLNLGHEIRTSSGEVLLDSARLLRLARLPWFRQAYIPDWLRLRLLDHLAPEQETQVRRTLELLLVTAVAGGDAAFDLEVASRHQRAIHALAGPLLRRLRRTSSVSDPVRDYVFAEFMTGRHRERLAVRVARVIPALGGRRATTGTRASPSSPWYRQAIRAVPLVAVGLIVSAKGITTGVRAVEAAWLKIPESPLPVGRDPRVLRPTSPASPISVASNPEQLMGPTPDSGGAPFRDTCYDVGEVRVRSGWWINAIQLTCRNASGPPVSMTRHGGEGGREQVFQLQPGERIAAMSGSHHGEYGNFVFSLQLRTDRGRMSPIYGNEGTAKGVTPFSFEVPPGRRFAGLVGRSGRVPSSDGSVDDFLVSIGIVHAAAADTVMALPLPAVAAGKALCAAINPILVLFPFAPKASTQASVARVTSMLAPRTGALWVYQRDHLGGLLAKSGDRWTPTIDGSAQLTAEFVAFFNQAARLSAFLFPVSSGQPRVDFEVRGEVPSAAKELTLTHDDAVARFTSSGQTFSLTWPSVSETTPQPDTKSPGLDLDAMDAGPEVMPNEERRSARAKLTWTGAKDNVEHVVAQASGDWALFALMASSDRVIVGSGSGNSVRAEWGDGKSDASPDRITVEFTFRSPFPMASRSPAARCPATVFR